MMSRTDILRQALIRVKAKKFALTLRQSPGYSANVPDADIDSMTDEEIKLYQETLREQGCAQEQDFKWYSTR